MVFSFWTEFSCSFYTHWKDDFGKKITDEKDSFKHLDANFFFTSVCDLSLYMVYKFSGANSVFTIKPNLTLMTFDDRLDGYEVRPQHPARYSSTEGETHQIHNHREALTANEDVQSCKEIRTSSAHGIQSIAWLHWRKHIEVGVQIPFPWLSWHTGMMKHTGALIKQMSKSTDNVPR